MNNIKKLVIILILILFLLISYFLIVNSFFLELDDDSNNTEESIVTDLGDEFLFAYHYSDFPDSQTEITIIDKKSNKEIGFYYLEKKPTKVKITNIINTSDVICYEVSNHLIYKVNDDNFKLINANEMDELDPDEYNSLVKVCSILTDKNNWYWLKVCAKFLINSGNSNIVYLFKNYANGQFTQEEIELNKNSGITKEDMQQFCKQLLNEET